MPVLVVIDIQKEYTTHGRDFYLHGIEPSLENARRLLAFAREHHWHIVHIQHIRADENSAVWNKNSPFINFVAGFEPLQGETKIIKHKFSCYSNPEFGSYIEEHKDGPLYIIGYNTRMCCLSTVVEGYHRGHSYSLVSDATLAKASKPFSEQDMHAHMLVAIEGVFAKVVTTDTLLS